MWQALSNSRKSQSWEPTLESAWCSHSVVPPASLSLSGLSQDRTIFLAPNLAEAQNSRRILSSPCGGLLLAGTLWQLFPKSLQWTTFAPAATPPRPTGSEGMEIEK